MRWLIACVLVVTSSCALADGPVYAELQLGAGGVSHSDLDFYPIFGTATLGAFVLPGIGLEVFGDTGIDSDEDGNFDMELEQAYGIAARFQSPSKSGLQGFIVLGVVNYTLDQQSGFTGAVIPAPVNEEFRGMRISVGVMQRLRRFPYLQFTAEYRHYNADERLRLDALVFGWRVNAP